MSTSENIKCIKNFYTFFRGSRNGSGSFRTPRMNKKTNFVSSEYSTTLYHGWSTFFLVSYHPLMLSSFLCRSHACNTKILKDKLESAWSFQDSNETVKVSKGRRSLATILKGKKSPWIICTWWRFPLSLFLIDCEEERVQLLHRHMKTIVL